MPLLPPSHPSAPTVPLSQNIHFLLFSVDGQRLQGSHSPLHPHTSPLSPLPSALCHPLSRPLSTSSCRCLLLPLSRSILLNFTMDEEYDVIMLDTALKECILSFLISIDGLKIFSRFSSFSFFLFFWGGLILDFCWISCDHLVSSCVRFLMKQQCLD